MHFHFSRFPFQGLSCVPSQMIDWIFIHLDKFHVATFRDCAIYFALAYLIIFSIIFLYVYRFRLTVLIFHRFPFIFRHILIHFPFALFRSPSLHFQNSFPSISLYLWSFPLSSFIVTNFDILDFPTYRGLRHLLSTGIIEHIFNIFLYVYPFDSCPNISSVFGIKFVKFPSMLLPHYLLIKISPVFSIVLCFHPFPFFWWHSPLYSCIANNFDTLGGVARFTWTQAISCMHLLVVAPSTLHWLMFAHALVCLLISGNFLLFSIMSRFFLLLIVFSISLHFSSSSWIFHPFLFSVGGCAIYFALAYVRLCSCMYTNFRSMSLYFQQLSFFLLLIVFVLICLHFSSFSWIFHPFPFSRWHSPLYLYIANNFDTFWEMLRDLLGGRHISCMHLLVVAPSTLHWVMFAYALACLLIFGQCPFIFNNFPYFPPAYRFFWNFPSFFFFVLHCHPFSFSRWHSPLSPCMANSFDTFWEMLRDLLGHRHISCMHLLVTGGCAIYFALAYVRSCSCMSTLNFSRVPFASFSSSFSIFQLFAFFWWHSPCISTLWLRHVHQKHTPKIPEQRASPMTGSQKKIAIWSKGRRILTNR